MRVNYKQLRKRISREFLVLGRGLGAGFGGVGLTQFFGQHHFLLGVHLLGIAFYLYIAGVSLSIWLDCVNGTDES